MNTIVEINFSFDIAHAIPAITALMVFASILYAGTHPNDPRVVRHRRIAWSLGIGSQLLLQGFAVLTGVFTFGFYLLPAAAFAYNMWRSYRPKELISD